MTLINILHWILDSFIPVLQMNILTSLGYCKEKEMNKKEGTSIFQNAGIFFF